MKIAYISFFIHIECAYIIRIPNSLQNERIYENMKSIEKKGITWNSKSIVN